tara:strand:+ start:3013 stop:3378 length:366 start_codon:yes stop_codon:yes gene_type:complete
MKHLLKSSFLIFGIFILESCSVTENTQKYCPEDGCLLVRENPNDRFSEEDTKSEFEQEFEALEVSNDFPYPPEGQSFLKEGLVPRPKKYFHLRALKVWRFVGWEVFIGYIWRHCLQRHGLY